MQHDSVYSERVYTQLYRNLPIGEGAGIDFGLGRLDFRPKSRNPSVTRRYGQRFSVIMTIQSILKRYFPYLKYATGGFALLLWVWVTSTVTIRSCGGPFPDRTRGPMAKSEYYRLGELPEWENMIARTDGEGRNMAERFIQGLEIPVLEFGEPPVIVDEPAPVEEMEIDPLDLELPSDLLPPADGPLDATP